MWLDTHCHLDAAEFDADRADVVARAQAAGVTALVVPSVSVPAWRATVATAHHCRGAYALGIHPMYTPSHTTDDLLAGKQALAQRMSDPRLVAVGEIGLDGWVSGLDEAHQQHFFEAQLRWARDLDLPVLLHVRRRVDQVLAGLRKFGVRQGIAHAFNGSEQQALAMIKQGLKLGFGGTLTHERSLQIRRLATGLPAHALVLETDAPDIPPAWCVHQAGDLSIRVPARNEPHQAAAIGTLWARLRDCDPQDWAEQTWQNACEALPRLKAALSSDNLAP